MGYHSTTSLLPPLIKCPRCLNAERTTACRFCGISKLEPPPAVEKVGFAVEAGFASDFGAVKVGFRGSVDGQPVRVVAVLAPPDPPVGLLDPYPLEVQAVGLDGQRVALSYAQARLLCSDVLDQLF